MEKTENLNKFNKLLMDILNLKEEDIRDDLSPEQVETWDSFNGLVIASELESIFNLKFTIEEVVDVKTIGDMKNVLRKHNIKIWEEKLKNG